MKIGDVIRLLKDYTYKTRDSMVSGLVEKTLLKSTQGYVVSILPEGRVFGVNVADEVVMVVSREIGVTWTPPKDSVVEVQKELVAEGVALLAVQFPVGTKGIVGHLSRDTLEIFLNDGTFSLAVTYDEFPIYWKCLGTDPPKSRITRLLEDDLIEDPS